jgi:hypothetical protein
VLVAAVAKGDKAEEVATELVRLAANTHPDVDASTMHRAFELAAAKIRARVKAKADGRRA